MSSRSRANWRNCGSRCRTLNDAVVEKTTGLADGRVRPFRRGEDVDLPGDPADVSQCPFLRLLHHPSAPSRRGERQRIITSSPRRSSGNGLPGESLSNGWRITVSSTGRRKRRWTPFSNQGYDLILDIEPRGAKAIREHYPRGVFIFILPPSLSELKSRLAKRGESAAVMERRLQTFSG